MACTNGGNNMKKWILATTITSALLLGACSGNESDKKEEQIEESTPISNLEEAVEGVIDENTPVMDGNMVEFFEQQTGVQDASVKFTTATKTVDVEILATKDITKEQAELLADSQIRELEVKYTGYEINLVILKNGEELYRYQSSEQSE